MRSGAPAAAHEFLDLTGLLCPLPVLRLRRRLRHVAPGTRVVLLVTDPAAPLDVKAFCNIEGHDYLGEREAAPGTIEIALRAGAGGTFAPDTPVL